MKLVFKPIPLILGGISIWITQVFLSLIRFDPLSGWEVGTYGIWGDWSAHLTFINGFRERGLTLLASGNPLFEGAPFRYPFLSHLFTAKLADLIGMDSIQVMKLTSGALLLLLPWLLFRFHRRLGLSSRASFYGTLAFLFMGGLQFLDRGLDSSKALTNQFESGSFFTQFLVYEFIPQRAFLFGICLFLWAFGSLRKNASTGKLYGLVILLGLMPLIHLHSFIAVAILLFCLWIFPDPDSRLFQNRRSAFTLSLLIGGIGALSVLFLFRTKNPTPHSWNLFLPGWAQNPAAGMQGASAMNPLWFWVYNTALFIPLSIAGAVLARKNRSLSALMTASLLLFLIALIFCIQPYWYDNLKIFTYAFLLAAPFLGIGLEALHSKFAPLAVFLISIQCASGAHDLFKVQRGLERADWLGPSELRLAAEFKKIRTSPDDLVLINPTHNHPIPCLTGNPVIMGYGGWLWSWGINPSPLEHPLLDFFSGTDGAREIPKRLRAKYIVVNANHTYRNQPMPFALLDREFEKVTTVDQWSIYRVSSPSR